MISNYRSHLKGCKFFFRTPYWLIIDKSLILILAKITEIDKIASLNMSGHVWTNSWHFDENETQDETQDETQGNN